MAIKSLFSVSFLIWMCLQMDLYSTIKVEINPETFNKDYGSTVDVTCKLDKSERDAKEVMLMRIARKGERAIVLMHRNNSLTYSAGNQQEFPAKGKIEKNVMDTKLTMTIKTPDPEDSGAYTCIVYYITRQGSVKENKASGYLTVEDPALHELNATIKKLQDDVDKGNKLINSLQWRDTLDKVKLDDLDSRVDKQSKELLDLAKKDNDVDNRLKKMEDRMMDQMKKMTQDMSKKIADDKTKVATLESTVLHQVETIRDLTEKLAEFEKTIQDLTKEVKKNSDNNSKPATGSSDDTKDDIRNLKETIELLTKTVNDVTDKADENEESVRKMTSAALVMSQKIDDNLKQVSNVEKKLTNLEDETKAKLKKLTIDGLDNDFLNLQDKVKENTQQIKVVGEKANEAKAIGEKMKAVTGVLAKQIRDNIDASSKGHVAFHATTGTWGLIPKENEPLKFYDVALNEGDGYNKDTGVFTVPKAGIYAFYMFLQVPCHGCKLEVTIEADDKTLSRFTGGSANSHDQHSINAVTKLQPDSKVRVLVKIVGDPPSLTRWIIGGVQKCGFSGFLVAPS